MAERKSLAAVARRAVGAAMAVGATVTGSRSGAAAAAEPSPQAPAEQTPVAKPAAAEPAAKQAATKKAAAAKAPPKKAAPLQEASAGAEQAVVPAVKRPAAARVKKAAAAAKKAAAAPAKEAAATPAAGVPDALAVHADEDPWTPAELAVVREELAGEVERLGRDMAALETSIADVLRDSVDGAGDDQADTGSKAFEREQEMTLLANAREARFQTRRALNALEDGTYGRCESCGNPIGKARLQAFPRATLCVPCKQKQERR